MATRRASTVLILAVVYIDMLGIGLAFPILPRLIQHFVGGDFSRASWIFGLISSAYALTQFFFAPVLGGLSDRYGRSPSFFSRCSAWASTISPWPSRPLSLGWSWDVSSRA